MSHKTDYRIDILKEGAKSRPRKRPITMTILIELIIIMIESFKNKTYNFIIILFLLKGAI
ncbi:hypothetical protein J2TS4_19390 [Paenibacillus sp. J2TS4]|nr:hypothetical protein J2TS4_19390 [Paenibacillus sp. J2TS4]